MIRRALAHVTRALVADDPDLRPSRLDLLDGVGAPREPWPYLTPEARAEAALRRAQRRQALASRP